MIGVTETQIINDYDQRLVVVTNGSTPLELKRITPQNGETGTILIRYNASDNNTTKQVTANRYKLIRFIKTFAGVASVENTFVMYTNNSPGANSVDFTVTESGGDLVIKVTGTTGLMMHTMRIEILSGVLEQ